MDQNAVAVVVVVAFDSVVMGALAAVAAVVVVPVLVGLLFDLAAVCTCASCPSGMGQGYNSSNIIAVC